MHLFGVVIETIPVADSITPGPSPTDVCFSQPHSLVCLHKADLMYQPLVKPLSHRNICAANDKATITVPLLFGTCRDHRETVSCALLCKTVVLRRCDIYAPEKILAAVGDVGHRSEVSVVVWETGLCLYSR